MKSLYNVHPNNGYNESKFNSIQQNLINPNSIQIIRIHPKLGHQQLFWILFIVKRNNLKMLLFPT